MIPRRYVGKILLALAVIGVTGAIGMVVAHTAEVNSRVGAMVPVLVLEVDVAPNEAVTEAMVEVLHVPERWVPESRMTSPDELERKVAASPLQAGSFLQHGMLVYRSVVGPRQSRVALSVSPEPVLAGDVEIGGEVAVYGAFTTSDPKRPRCLTLLVPAARVVDVTAPKAGADAGTATVSIVVNNSYTRRLLYAASFAEDIRVTTLGPGATHEWPEPTGCGPGGGREAKETRPQAKPDARPRRPQPNARPRRPQPSRGKRG